MPAIDILYMLRVTLGFAHISLQQLLFEQPDSQAGLQQQQSLLRHVTQPWLHIVPAWPDPASQ